MTSPAIAIFCDFDGTIARRDVGYHMFHHFSKGRNDELLPDWKAGRMTSREILVRQAEMVSASPEEILAFVDSFEIDETFVPFVAACSRSELPVIIVSEGLDIYIKRLLARHHLDHLEIISNTGIMAGGKLHVEFPHSNKSCRACGSCKGERIKEYRVRASSDTRVVFVGDGYSDACAAAEADILFAKKDLCDYCLRQGIPYNTYDTFDDVTRQLGQAGYLEI